MTHHSAYMPIELNDLAEGSPGAYELSEPASPLKTITVPAVVSDVEENDSAAAETGMVSAVDMHAEGKDDGDVQDASRTTDEAKKAPHTEPAVEAKKHKAPIVLIVEDTTELAEVIQATLERMNMVTIHETHGNKALAKFKEMDPDVVLLDISLPDMTGWKILDAIKERHEQGIPSAKMPIVIVITAYGDPANRLVGKLQGVHSYLIKPFTSDEIEKIVTQALSSPAQ